MIVNQYKKTSFSHDLVLGTILDKVKEDNLFIYLFIKIYFLLTFLLLYSIK